MRPCLHFVGFPYPRYEKDERVWRAIAIWGWPDFYHRSWDNRARREIADGDTIIFAKGDENQTPTDYSYDDSAHF
jgi:hypothetical protein